VSEVTEGLVVGEHHVVPKQAAGDGRDEADDE
jgi:hypothetical protein